MGIVELCSEAGAAETPEVQVLLEDVFMTLVMEAEQAIRRRLAEHIADAAWAPHALVNVLALDDIEIAQPIIARSPVLQDRDLLRLLVEATLEHRIEIARRPELSETVAQAALARGEPAVLSALARNGTARLSVRTMEQLVLASRKLADLRAPLARHPRLSGELAAMLYGWVGQALRETLAQRFRVDEAELEAAVAAATRRAHDSGVEAPKPAAPENRDLEREQTEHRLVAKLHESGKLRPGYLIRTLKDGKLGLFEAALATMLGLSPESVRRIVRSDRPELLALACAAVGIDRAVYPPVLTDLRRLSGGFPKTGEDSAKKVAAAFGHGDPARAAGALRTALAG